MTPLLIYSVVLTAFGYLFLWWGSKVPYKKPMNAPYIACAFCIILALIFAVWNVMRLLAMIP